MGDQPENKKNGSSTPSQSEQPSTKIEISEAYVMLTEAQPENNKDGTLTPPQSDQPLTTIEIGEAYVILKEAQPENKKNGKLTPPQSDHPLTKVEIDEAYVILTEAQPENKKNGKLTPPQSDHPLTKVEIDEAYVILTEAQPENKKNGKLTPPQSDQPLTKVEIDKAYTTPFPQQPPAYNQGYPPQQQPYPPQQVYYYPDPNYNRQTPAYYQQMPNQNYYGGYPGYSGYPGYPQPPMNAAGGPPVRPRDPNQEFNFFGGDEIFTDAFNTIKIRNRFVQRVYTILSVQLVVTFFFVFLATYEPNTKKFMNAFALPIMIVSMIIFMTVYCCVICTAVRHQFPLNFILLGIITFAMTLILMCLTAHVPPLIVLCATGTTAALCLTVSIFACQTKWDVTGCGMCMCIAGVMLMLYGIVVIILNLAGIHMPILHVVFSAIATILFTFYLMYDTQMIVGGRRLELSPEEYIVGALSLYIDIVYIFMHLIYLYQYCLGGSNE